MNRQRFLISILFLIPVYWCFDGNLITSIEIRPSNPDGIMSCDSVSLQINGKNETPICEAWKDNEFGSKNNITFVKLTYNGTEPITEFKNVTLHLIAKITDYSNSASPATLNYTGVFAIDENARTNEITVGNAILNEVASPVITTTTAVPTTTTKSASPTTPAPKLPISSNQTFLTINYIHLKYDDSKPKTEKNGGAVAVAIIEGIALIAILAYMGYRTMVKHRMKETTMNAAMYGYDSNNSRITVPDSIRMSDIPPPRDPTYAVPATPTVQSQPTPSRNTVMTTQELVVPTSAAVNRPTTTTNTNEQFRDPFDSLENW